MTKKEAKERNGSRGKVRGGVLDMLHWESPSRCGCSVKAEMRIWACRETVKPDQHPSEAGGTGRGGDMDQPVGVGQDVGTVCRVSRNRAGSWTAQDLRDVYLCDSAVLTIPLPSVNGIVKTPHLPKDVKNIVLHSHCLESTRHIWN